MDKTIFSEIQKQDMNLKYYTSAKNPSTTYFDCIKDKYISHTDVRILINYFFSGKSRSKFCNNGSVYINGVIVIITDLANKQKLDKADVKKIIGCCIIKKHCEINYDWIKILKKDNLISREDEIELSNGNKYYQIDTDTISNLKMSSVQIKKMFINSSVTEEIHNYKKSDDITTLPFYKLITFNKYKFAKEDFDKFIGYANKKEKLISLLLYFDASGYEFTGDEFITSLCTFYDKMIINFFKDKKITITVNDFMKKLYTTNLNNLSLYNLNNVIKKIIIEKVFKYDGEDLMILLNLLEPEDTLLILKINKIKPSENLVVNIMCKCNFYESDTSDDESDEESGDKSNNKYLFNFLNLIDKKIGMKYVCMSASTGKISIFKYYLDNKILPTNENIIQLLLSRNLNDNIDYIIKIFDLFKSYGFAFGVDQYKLISEYSFHDKLVMDMIDKSNIFERGVITNDLMIECKIKNTFDKIEEISSDMERIFCKDIENELCTNPSPFLLNYYILKYDVDITLLDKICINSYSLILVEYLCDFYKYVPSMKTIMLNRYAVNRLYLFNKFSKIADLNHSKISLAK